MADVEDLVPPDITAALTDAGYTIVRTAVLEVARADLDTRAAINRQVATMHVEVDGQCVECRRPFPCRTARLTDGELDG